MNEFDIYTIGAGYYLEKIFNAIRMIMDGRDKFITVMQIAAILSLVALAIKNFAKPDLYAAVKWFIGIAVLSGLFLNTKATVIIHDRLPDSYGHTPAERKVENVPWGLAVIGYVTSGVGAGISEKFDMALSAVFVNPEYQKNGILFGSKIMEDVSKIRIADSSLKAFMLKFYKQCIVPDVNMGYNRANGYTVKDLAETDNILDFLKNHASKARMVYFAGDMKVLNKKAGIFGDSTTVDSKRVDDYISCNQAAHYIASTMDYEIESRMPILASSFLGQFFPDNEAKADKDSLFKSVLTGSYGMFIRNSSREAKDILLQNVLINSLNDSIDNAYGSVSTREITKSAWYSLAQAAQRYIPIIRAVLECLFYGVFPIILILMLSPNGLAIFQNYLWGFVYLQIWMPMYTILYSISSAAGKHYASGIKSLTYASHSQIAAVNDEISIVAGMLLIAVPTISIFITRGMMSGMGNLAGSIFYVPQNTAMHNAESTVKGNYQIGTTSVDTHGYNTTTANKYDDNYSWVSGMKSFSMPSGATEKMFGDGRTGLDSTASVSNLAGLARIDWNKAIGSRYDKSINESMSQADRQSSAILESSVAGYSKLLGYNEDFSRNSSAYQSWQSGLNAEQRSALDYSRGVVNKVAEDHGISQQDALRLAVAGNLNIGFGKGKNIGASIMPGFDGSTGATKAENFNKIIEASQDKRFTEGLNKVASFASSNAHQENNAIAQSMLYSAKSDFANSQTASFERSKAIEHAHSLQASKGAFQQDSRNITQDLTNFVTEKYIKQMGAMQFDDMIRNDPVRTNRMLDQALDTIVNTGYTTTSNQYDAEKHQFSNANLAHNHQDNVQAIRQMHRDSKAIVKHEAPDNLPPDIHQKLESSHAHKQGVIKDMNNADESLNTQEKGLQNQVNKLENKVGDKTSQSATGRLTESWNPFKKDEAGNNQ